MRLLVGWSFVIFFFFFSDLCPGGKRELKEFDGVKKKGAAVDYEEEGFNER